LQGVRAPLASADRLLGPCHLTAVIACGDATDRRIRHRLRWKPILCGRGSEATASDAAFLREILRPKAAGSALGLSARAIEQLRGEGIIGKVATSEESNAPARGRVKN
jgi:hypothetical protein